MNTITKGQLSKIHVLLSQAKLTDQKAMLVQSFSRGRCTSCKELTMNEAIEFIKYLSVEDANNSMRRKVFALAYEAEIIWGDTPADKRMNSAKLNKFLLERGTVRKSLNDMDRGELIKTVNQFQQIVKHTQESKQNKETRSMLSELNISVITNRRKIE